ncbi:MAG: hypothetical protein WCY38_02085 [Endomicrobiia bacterium]
MQKFFDKLNNFQIALILFFIISIIHIDIIWAPVGYYFSKFDLKDLNYYINIRQYVSDSLLSGVIPLWTLNIFSGHPFFANSETATFYPFNFIFLFLPISKAINWSFLLHFFILSFSVFLWINNKINKKIVSLYTAIIAVFSASFYLHAVAGHLSNIITVAWFPLLLFLYDRTFKNNNYKLIIPISAVISLQIFAGHFQYVYYTAIVSFIYVLFFCFNKTTIITLVFSYFVALSLSAVQLLPSVEFYLQGARISGILQHVSIKSSMSHLITLMFPVFTEFTSYYFWETAIYIGIFNILIISLAIFNNFKKKCLKYILLIVILYLLTYQHIISYVLSAIIPLFNNFRSPIKLNFFISILTLPLLSYGIIQIISKDIKINKYFIYATIIFAIVIIIFSSKLSPFIINLFSNDATLHNSFQKPILITGCFVLLFSICLFFKKYIPVRIIILLIAILQPILFVKNYTKPFFFNNDYKYERMKVFYKNNDIRYFSNEKYSLQYNYENIFGTTSDVLKNYLDFIKHLEAPNVDTENIFAMLRCKYVVDDDTSKVSQYNVKMLKRVNIFYKYITEQDKEKTFSILFDKDFDFLQTVVLDKEPKYKPVNQGISTINILSLNDNKIEIECKTTEPAIILVSSNYEKGWKAYNLDNKDIKYEIIQANYIYRAISVDKGVHRIRFEYKPLSFLIGSWISVFSWVLLIITAISLYCKRKYIKLK